MISLTQFPLPDNTQHSQETDIHSPGGIRIRNPASERPQTHALDRLANGIGCPDDIYPELKIYISELILDRDWYVPVTYVTVHCIIWP